MKYSEATIIIPKDVDRQLRVLASSRGSGVGPMVRERVSEKLSEAEGVDAARARAHDAEMIEHIQALMDRGVTFHRIETKETGKIRKRVMDNPIASTGEIEDRRVLITDAEIEKLVLRGIGHKAR